MLFAPVGDEVSRELRDGKGFVVLQGIPVERWNRLETVIAWWGIGCLLGTPIPNNAIGDMIGHVTDLGADVQHANVRGYETNAKLAYHTDQSDVVGLLCLQTAQSGGLSKVVSAGAVYNEILERRPDLLETLCQPFYFSRLGEVGPKEQPWYQAPVFEIIDGVLHTASGGGHIRKGHALDSVPDLTSSQRDALDLFEEVSQSLEFSMNFQPGDIQLLNNGLVAHTRTGFVDWPDPDKRRHLLRLWLRVPDMHAGAAYFENWRNGVRPRDNQATIRLSPQT